MKNVLNLLISSDLQSKPLNVRKTIIFSKYSHFYKLDFFMLFSSDKRIKQLISTICRLTIIFVMHNLLISFLNNYLSNTV